MNFEIEQVSKRCNLGYFRWNLAIILLFSICYTGFTQGNLKAGYVANYYNYSLLGNTIDVFNSGLSSEYVDQMTKMKIGHGVEVGYRRMFETFALDLSYSIDFASASTIIGKIDSTNFELRQRHHAFHGGVESYFGPFGLGAAAQYNLLRLSGKSGAGSFALLDNPNYLSVKLYMIYVLPSGSQNSITLQPYIDVPLASNHKLDGVSQFLNETASREGKLPLSFGFRLLIYNGAQ